MPSPLDVISSFSDADANANILGAEALLKLLSVDDPVSRWGTAYFLQHIPFRAYLPHLLKAMQVSNQPEEIQQSARILDYQPLLNNHETIYSLTSFHSRVRNLLQLTAHLYNAPVQPHERRP